MATLAVFLIQYLLGFIVIVALLTILLAITYHVVTWRHERALRRERYAELRARAGRAS